MSDLPGMVALSALAVVNICLQMYDVHRIFIIIFIKSYCFVPNNWASSYYVFEVQ